MSSFSTLVKSAFKLIEQPDSQTCQSACLKMAGVPLDVMSIRQSLLSLGDAGSPQNMGLVAKRYLGARYSFDEDASLKDCQKWLKDGEFLITHGWFTGSGHVIGLDGLELDEKSLSYRLNVKDPWGEFNASRWAYNLPGNSYDGFYSSWLIYAACVAGKSQLDAESIYRRGELDSSKGGMWVHRIKPDGQK